MAKFKFVFVLLVALVPFTAIGGCGNSTKPSVVEEDPAMDEAAAEAYDEESMGADDAASDESQN